MEEGIGKGVHRGRTHAIANTDNSNWLYHDYQRVRDHNGKALNMSDANPCDAMGASCELNCRVGC